MAGMVKKQFWETVEALLSKPPNERDRKAIESIMVWFRNNCPMFRNLEDGGYIQLNTLIIMNDHKNPQCIVFVLVMMVNVNYIFFRKLQLFNSAIFVVVVVVLWFCFLCVFFSCFFFIIYLFIFFPREVNYVAPYDHNLFAFFPPRIFAVLLG